MNEVDKVEIIKTGKKLLDNGCITEEDFTYIKNAIITNEKTTLTPLEELEKLKQKESEGVITSDDYESLKRELLAGKKIADSERIPCLPAFKESVNKGIINDDEFSDIKKDVLSADSKRDFKMLEKQLQNLEEYKRLVKDGILTEDQYEPFKKKVLQGKVISSNHGYGILYGYKQLLEEGMIDSDDFDAVRKLLVQGKHPSWVDDTSYLRKIYKYHQDGLISDDDYANNKAVFLSGKKPVSTDVLDKLYAYKDLVKDSIITESDYDDIRGNLMKSFPVKSAEELRSLEEYNGLREQGVITQEEYDSYKEGLLPKPLEVVEKGIKEEKKKTKKKYALGGLAAALILAVLLLAFVVVPRLQAKKAFDEYIAAYDMLLDDGKYQDAENAANDILEKHEEFLNDSDKATLNSRINYASAIEMLNFTDGIPGQRVDIELARAYLEGSDGYGISAELLRYLDDKEDTCDNDLYGTLYIDHSKYKETKAENDSVADGVSVQLDGSDIFGNAVSNSVNETVDFVPTFSIRGSYNPNESRYNNDSSKEEEKKKPVINEYDCEGYITLGFREKSKGNGLNSDNIEKIIVLHAELKDSPEEKDICTIYDAVFEADKSTEIEVSGSGAAPVTGKGSLDGDSVKVDFGNGITLELSPSSSSSSSYGSSSSGSGSSSNNNDYSPGSEWENYDSDSDGQINDQEFQDAVGDYMDQHGY